MAKGSVGMVMRITGPVVDIKFEPNELPEIFHAVTIEHKGEKFVLEVAQQRGNGEVRCISMHPTDGMSRGMDAYDTKGNPIVPQSESNTNIFLIYKILLLEVDHSVKQLICLYQVILFILFNILYLPKLNQLSLGFKSFRGITSIFLQSTFEYFSLY